MSLHLYYGGADHHIRIEFNNNSQYYKSTADELKQSSSFLSFAKTGVAYILSFFKSRNERRERVKKKLGIDIVALEQLYETMEGSARYIEYCLYRHFGNFNFSDAKWLYTVGRKYYYATGFNLLRLSDKLEIDYKYGIFKYVSIVERNLRILMSE